MSRFALLLFFAIELVLFTISALATLSACILFLCLCSNHRTPCLFGVYVVKFSRGSFAQVAVAPVNLRTCFLVFDGRCHDNRRLQRSERVVFLPLAGLRYQLFVLPRVLSSDVTQIVLIVVWLLQSNS